MARESRANRAKKKLAKATDDRLLKALLFALKTPEGRSLLFELLREGGMFRSCWDDSELRMARKVGQQEYAHWLYAQCIAADDNNSDLMFREGRAFDVKAELSVKAQVATDTDTDEDDDEFS
jgi:uncharacterized cupin superfamily protein